MNEQDPHVAFIKYNPYFNVCNLSSSIEGIITNTTDYIIIGSNGPINANRLSTNVSIVFLPNEFAKKLHVNDLATQDSIKLP